MKQGKLLTTGDIMERYQCSDRTARRYMRQMVHQEKPLRVTEAALETWEINRTCNPQETSKASHGQRAQRRNVVIPPQGKFLISRVRPKQAQAREGRP